MNSPSTEPRRPKLCTSVSSDTVLLHAPQLVGNREGWTGGERLHGARGEVDRKGLADKLPADSGSEVSITCVTLPSHWRPCHLRRNSSLIFSMNPDRDTSYAIFRTGSETMNQQKHTENAHCSPTTRWLWKAIWQTDDDWNGRAWRASIYSAKSIYPLRQEREITTLKSICTHLYF